jgi:hypothetical protein
VVAFHRSTEHMHICVHGTTGLRVKGRRMRGRKKDVGRARVMAFWFNAIVVHIYGPVRVLSVALQYADRENFRVVFSFYNCYSMIALTSHN